MNKIKLIEIKASMHEILLKIIVIIFFSKEKKMLKIKLNIKFINEFCFKGLFQNLYAFKGLFLINIWT